MNALAAVIASTARPHRDRGAYSYSIHYRRPQWAAIARFLAAQGLAPGAVEWILRSKHMRWCADRARGQWVDSWEFADYWRDDANGVRGDAASWREEP